MFGRKMSCLPSYRELKQQEKRDDRRRQEQKYIIMKQKERERKERAYNKELEKKQRISLMLEGL
jgi:hypothetical protein